MSFSDSDIKKTKLAGKKGFFFKKNILISYILLLFLPHVHYYRLLFQ